MNTAREYQPDTALSVRDVTVAWHRKPVLWDATFEVSPVQLVGVIGPNGGWQVALLKAIMELVPLKGRSH